MEIVTVYSKRSYSIGRELFYVTEEMFNQALVLAQRRDQQTQEAVKNGTTDQLGPFHGIPVSFKDTIAVKDVIISCGADSSADYVAQEDAAMVKLIL